MNTIFQTFVSHAEKMKIGLPALVNYGTDVMITFFRDF
jgi:hypothetical protein